MALAKKHHSRKCCKDKSDANRQATLRKGDVAACFVVVNFKSRGHSVALKPVKAISIGDDKDDGKQRAKPLYAKPVFDVVSWTAFKAKNIFGLINLSQSTLNKG